MTASRHRETVLRPGLSAQPQHDACMPRCDDVDSEREVHVEEDDALLVRGDECPSSTPCQRDIVDCRDDKPEDALVHPEVCEHRVLVAAKEVPKQVVHPPSTWTHFCLILHPTLSFSVPHHRFLSGFDSPEEAGASFVWCRHLLLPEIEHRLI